MYTNQNPLSASVRMPDGASVRLDIAPQHAVVAGDRVIRAFSVDFPDGSVRNYFLDHRGIDRYDRVEGVVKLLATYGLVVLEGKMISRRGMSHPERFALWAGKQDTNGKIVNWLADRVRGVLHHSDYGYFDMASGHLVLEEPLVVGQHERLLAVTGR